MTVKKIKLLTVVTLLLMCTLLRAQTLGSNDVSQAGEVDTVSVGSTSQYYLMPDVNFNPGFDYTVNLYANIQSTFNWVNTGPEAFTVQGGHPNHVAITWQLPVGARTITGTETAAPALGGCSTDKPFAVEVVEGPTVHFTKANGVLCDGESQLLIPAIATSAVTNPEIEVEISYTIDGGAPQSATLTPEANYELSFGAALNAGQLVEVTLGSVTDKISRRSFVPLTGDVDDNNDGNPDKFFIYVIRTIPTLKTSARP